MVCSLTQKSHSSPNKFNYRFLIFALAMWVWVCGCMGVTERERPCQQSRHKFSTYINWIVQCYGATFLWNTKLCILVPLSYSIQEKKNESVVHMNCFKQSSLLLMIWIGKIDTKCCLWRCLSIGTNWITIFKSRCCFVSGESKITLCLN